MDPITNPATPDAIFGKDAVCEALADHVAVGALEAPRSLDAKWDRKELTLTVAPETIAPPPRPPRTPATTSSKTSPPSTGTPPNPASRSAYSILSMGLKQRIRIDARLSGDNPRIDSITSIWPSANFYEREVFDLFGIHFAGHPRLTRIMMPDNWKGHPLRKDYPVEGYR